MKSLLLSAVLLAVAGCAMSAPAQPGLVFYCATCEQFTGYATSGSTGRCATCGAVTAVVCTEHDPTGNLVQASAAGGCKECERVR